MSLPNGTHPPAPNLPGLPRVLGFWDGLGIGVGMVIGAGIFLTAPGIARHFTSPGPVFLVWIVGAILSFLGALTFAELSAGKPRTGGIYVFLLEGYGRPMGFVFGWQHLLLGPAGLGALGLAFAEFLTNFLGVDWNKGLVGAVTIALLTGVCCFSTRGSAMLMKIFASLKVLTLAVLIGGGIALLSPNPRHFEGLTTFAASDGSLMGALAVAIFAVIWTFGGWDNVTLVAGEVREPQKTMPRILLATLTVVTVIYLAVNVVYVNALGVRGMAGSRDVARDTGTLMLGQAFGAGVTLMILCSIFSTVNGNLLTNARVIYALAQNGLTFRFFGIKHPRRETPVPALAFYGAAAIVFMLLWPNFFRLLEYQTFALLWFFALTAGAVFIFRARGEETPYRVPFYPWTPLVYILLNLAMLLNWWVSRPLPGVIILGILLAGVPVYFLWQFLTAKIRTS